MKRRGDNSENSSKNSGKRGYGSFSDDHVVRNVQRLSGLGQLTTD
jgi:hypothetical protein